MAAVPSPEVAPPLSSERLQTLRSAVAEFDYDQLLWSSGYLAGLARASLGEAGALPQAQAAAAEDAWTVFYATETGNSRRVAEALAERARQAGLAVELQDLADFRPKGLAKVKQAAFVVATHGLGDAPEGSEAFFEHWLGERAQRLETLRYTVLALGDSSYADFCEIGRLLDERLAALGAKRVLERVECDVDFDARAESWTAQLVEHAVETAEKPAAAPARRLHAVAAPSAAWTRSRPYTAEIVVDQPLTGPGSTKDVRHMELDIESSGLTYLPGDSLGIVPRNPPALVEAVLAAAKLDGTQEVTVNDKPMPLADALAAHKEITVLNRPLIETVAPRHEALQQILAEREQLAAFLATRQVIDLIADYPAEWTPQSFADALRQLTPRLYSIASSPDANPGEVHLTVGVVRYKTYGREHWGAASNFLTGGTREAPVYVEPNDRFRLPADGDTPIVMVGAGTGVAPYRAFVEHRREHGHRGDNWLVFGERNFTTDFLYQLEWLRYRRDGLLTRMDVAFSRDQARKVYVQDRLREQGPRLWDWLQRGAHVYVCGDAERMAHDVHAALLDVVAREGGLSAERAAEYVNELKRGKRYQRDVY